MFGKLLEAIVLDEYYAERKKKDDVTVVLIRSNLPTLMQPLTKLFHESLANSPYNLRDTQIHELRYVVLLFCYKKKNHHCSYFEAQL